MAGASRRGPAGRYLAGMEPMCLTRRLAFGVWRSAFVLERGCLQKKACQSCLEAPSRNCTPRSGLGVLDGTCASR